MQLYLGPARKQHRSTLKGSKQKHEVLRFSSRREKSRSHVLNFRATSGQNVLYMGSDVLKEMSRFPLPSSGRRRLLLKVPITSIPATSFFFCCLLLPATISQLAHVATFLPFYLVLRDTMQHFIQCIFCQKRLPTLYHVTEPDSLTFTQHIPEDSSDVFLWTLCQHIKSFIYFIICPMQSRGQKVAIGCDG